MPEAVPVDHKMTLEEFRDWSDRQRGRFELQDGVPVAMFPEEDENGVITAMAAGSGDHHTIQGNAFVILSAKKRHECRAFTGAAVKVSERSHREPDASLTCVPMAIGEHYVREPCLLVEVLSPRTADVDRGTKLEEYTRLTSVEEIWLVDSVRRHAKVWHRREGGWFVTDTIGSGTFESDVLASRIEMDELYLDTAL